VAHAVALPGAVPTPAPDAPVHARPAEAAGPHAWPAVTQSMRPWTYWWWMASAVDQANLTRELQRYRDAGLGGVHIIPIYGAKGFEGRYVEYLSPQWIEMLRYTIAEARRLGLGVDLTTGSGWCFGGPRVTDLEANALVVSKTYELPAGQRLTEKLDPKSVQALVAFSPEGRSVELTVTPDGSVAWSPDAGTWRVYAVSQRPSGQKVKRASPGGQGHMLNLFYPDAMRRYLEWFEGVFADGSDLRPRALYHDSYEYRSDWAPDFLAAFEKRRGYRLQTQLPLLLSDEPSEPAARVKSDYRETASDLMIEETIPLWVDWAHRHGCRTRNEAHGSPGNWLDLYAVADIPETETFARDRSKLVSKFASSAAHVAGRQLVSAETGTWLKEHFTETLADMKYLLDDLFLSGVNHVIYHGTCYSPDDAPWPGWLFYASFQMNPRNPVWRDAAALNAYAARCQALLQSGRPDNDLLLYWPIHDLWHDPTGRVRNLTVHTRDWFEQQPIGRTAERLWAAGHTFDYVSDRQLATARCERGAILMPGCTCRAIVLPTVTHLPLPTARRLVELASAGATILVEGRLPDDVPGFLKADERRAELRQLLGRIQLLPPDTTSPPAGEGKPVLRSGAIGQGKVLVGDVLAGLAAAGISGEPMFAQPDLMCLRRRVADGFCYFVANRSETNAFHGWLPLARAAREIVLMDPLTGRVGMGACRQNQSSRPEVRLILGPGQSVILRCRSAAGGTEPKWESRIPTGPSVALEGTWSIRFVEGGPELPSPRQTARLGSWTDLGDTNTQRFAGTACYSLRFDAPPPHAGRWELDLGRVCQSARVRLNGTDLGTLFVAPFRVTVDALKANDNQLEIEVTSTAANRIRDLDRRGVVWRNFHDINFVNLQYKPFDAADWPVTDAGLLGPVTLTPVVAE